MGLFSQNCKHCGRYFAWYNAELRANCRAAGAGDGFCSSACAAAYGAEKRQAEAHSPIGKAKKWKTPLVVTGIGCLIVFHIPISWISAKVYGWTIFDGLSAAWRSEAGWIGSTLIWVTLAAVVFGVFRLYRSQAKGTLITGLCIAAGTTWYVWSHLDDLDLAHAETIRHSEQLSSHAPRSSQIDSRTKIGDAQIKPVDEELSATPTTKLKSNPTSSISQSAKSDYPEGKISRIAVAGKILRNPKFRWNSDGSVIIKHDDGVYRAGLKEFDEETQNWLKNLRDN